MNKKYCMFEIEPGQFVHCTDTNLDFSPCEDCLRKMEIKRGSEDGN